MIIVDDEAQVRLPIDAQKVIDRVIPFAMEQLECPYEFQVSVLLTDADEVHRLNREFRGIDRTTDVLSFPMLELPAPGDFSAVDESDPESFDPDTGELLLGDMVLNTSAVIAQAEEYGHTVERELAFLVLHSLLHLAGWDHEEERERIQMETLQEKILQDLHIERKNGGE